MDYTQITDALFIGTTPNSNDYAHLRGLGISLIINMRWEVPQMAQGMCHAPVPDEHTPPLQLLWLPTYDFPLLPIPIRKLEQGSHAALAALKTGARVHTYCREGKHRSVAMGSAILIAQGMNARDAMQLIRSRRAQADPDIWYIKRRIEKFEREWNNKSR